MRRLSTWAKLNPWKARFIIIAGHFLLGGIAYFLSMQLVDAGRELSSLFLCCCIGVFIITAAVYTIIKKKEKNAENKQYFFIRRKTGDLLIGICTFCMACWVFTNFHQYLPQFYPASQATSVGPSAEKPTAEEILNSLQYRDKKSLTRTEKRILKKEFRKQLKIYAKAKITGNKLEANKALLIILAVIAACGLISLLAGLACTISCNGSETLAFILFVVGTAGIIWLLVITINAIHRKKKKKEDTAAMKNAMLSPY